MSRHSLRGILILIIVVTIPCYIIGFGILIFVSENDVPTEAPSEIPNPILMTDTETPLIEATLESNPTTFVVVTLQPVVGITQLVPTTIFFNTATPIPTNIPINTTVPTAIPSATEQILLPPTDTPSP